MCHPGRMNSANASDKSHKMKTELAVHKAPVTTRIAIVGWQGLHLIGKGSREMGGEKLETADMVNFQGASH